MSENQNVIKDFLKNVEELGSNALTVSKKMLEGGKENVTLELVRKRIMPERMESPARAHIFYDAVGFSKYVEREKQTDTVIFADVENSVIYAVLNDRAEKGFEKVSLAPPYHPEFKLLKETLLDSSMDIMRFARNLMRNRNVLAGEPEKAKQLAMMMQQITVSSKITACFGVGAKSVNGIMCTTEAKAGVAEEQIELPDSVAVEVPIYINTDPVQFDIDLTITANKAGQVDIATDNPEMNVRKYEVFQGILEKVREVGDVIVTLGVPITSEWIYNK